MSKVSLIFPLWTLWLEWSWGITCLRQYRTQEPFLGLPRPAGRTVEPNTCPTCCRRGRRKRKSQDNFPRGQQRVGLTMLVRLDVVADCALTDVALFGFCFGRPWRRGKRSRPSVRYRGKWMRSAGKSYCNDFFLFVFFLLLSPVPCFPSSEAKSLEFPLSGFVRFGGPSIQIKGPGYARRVEFNYTSFVD